MDKQQFKLLLIDIEKNFNDLREVKKITDRYLFSIDHIRDLVEADIEHLVEIQKQEHISNKETDRLQQLIDYIGHLSTFYVYVKELEDIINEFPVEQVLSQGERIYEDV